MNLTTEQLTRIMPNVDPIWAPTYAVAATNTANKFQINTPLRMAAWLAIIAYESGQLRYWREIGQGGGSFGEYFGRGPLQLTWRENYRLAGAYLGLDLLNDPDMVARSTQVGFDTAGWFWRHGNGDLNDFADTGDFWTCYLRVAGADNGTFNARKVFYDRALAVLKEEGNEMTVTPQDLIETGRQMKGTPYGQWDGTWPPRPGAPFWMTGDVSVSLVKASTANCSGFINAILRINGLSPAGGTGSIGDYLIELEDFDVSSPAVPGAIALRPWSGGVGNLSEGHCAIFTGPHTLLQSDHRGVNEDDTDYESQPWAGFTVYGLLPGVDYENGSAPVQTDKELWRTFGWYEAINAEWDLRWHAPERS